MEKRLFVGNLPYSVDEDALEAAFADHGTVVSAVVIRDRESGRSRGFGFVEMGSSEDADKAIQALNGYEMNGRQLNVNEARERSGGGGRRY